MNRLLIATLVASVSLGLYGCDNDGPAEEAGESIDNAVDGLTDAADDVGDSLREAGEDACDAVGDATNSDADC